MTQQQERPVQGDKNALDFTQPHTYPRSGRDLVGGVVYLGRAIDKTRADLNGTPGEYIWACPQSRRVYDFFGVSPEQFREAVQKNHSDDGVARWLQEHGPKQPSKAETVAFNEQMLAAGPGPDQMGWFKKSLEEMGHGDRTDIKTFVDMQDLEEERL